MSVALLPSGKQQAYNIPAKEVKFPNLFSTLPANISDFLSKFVIQNFNHKKNVQLESNM